MTCSNCTHSKISEFGSQRIGLILLKGENNLFTCQLDVKTGEVFEELPLYPRKHTCGSYVIDKHFEGRELEYCPTCDRDTISDDWYCSECWSDRVDSELFEDYTANDD